MKMTIQMSTRKMKMKMSTRPKFQWRNHDVVLLASEKENMAVGSGATNASRISARPVKNARRNPPSLQRQQPPVEGDRLVEGQRLVEEHQLHRHLHRHLLQRLVEGQRLAEERQLHRHH